MMTESLGEMLRPCLITRAAFLLFILFITAATASSARGEVIITNLQSVEARFAEYRPVPNSQPRSWLVSGWKRILPGKSVRMDSGWIYLEQNRQAITFQNLRRTPCFVNQNIELLDATIPEGGLESTGR